MVGQGGRAVLSMLFMELFGLCAEQTGGLTHAKAQSASLVKALGSARARSKYMRAARC